jgi:hypothetical protein
VRARFALPSEPEPATFEAAPSPPSHVPHRSSLSVRLAVLAAFALSFVAAGLIVYSTGVLTPAARSEQSATAAGPGVPVTPLAWPGRALGLGATSSGVVWEQRSPVRTVSGLWLYDTTRGGDVTRLLARADMGRSDGTVVAAGSTVIWTGSARGAGRSDGRLYGLDLYTARRFTAARHGAAPAVFGETVIWVDSSRRYGAPGTAVVGDDLVTDERFVVRTGGAVVQAADAGGWTAWLAGDAKGTLYAVDRRHGTRHRLDTHGTALAMDSARLVWAARTGGGRTAVMLWDLSRAQSRELFRVRAGVTGLVLSGDLLAWQQDSGRGDVWAYDLRTHRLLAVCATAAVQVDPVIVGRTVFWADRRSGHWELYRRVLGASAG